MLRNSKQVGIRVFKEEKKLITEACKALSTKTYEVSPAQLVYTAGIDEAGSLGFTLARPSGAAKKSRRGWTNEPQRGDGNKPECLSITIHPLHLAPIACAAEWAEVSVPTFLFGATLAFLARRKQVEPENRRLQGLKLPPQYRAVA